MKSSSSLLLELTGEGAGLLETAVPEDATLADRAYLRLRDSIVTLRMAPGSLVREDVLMTELGMSRTPIREAILRLALENLVVVMPRRGTFVSDVNVGEVGLIYEMRREMESFAAALAARRRNAADIEAIDALIKELKAVSRSPKKDGVDARSQITLDQKAHYLIYRMSGNPFAERVLQSYFFLSARIWFLASGRVTMEEPFPTDVLEAVKDGDPDAARKLAEEHSLHAERTIRAAL